MTTHRISGTVTDHEGQTTIVGESLGRETHGLQTLAYYTNPSKFASWELRYTVVGDNVFETTYYAGPTNADLLFGPDER
jgi:hypothetical protein